MEFRDLFKPHFESRCNKLVPRWKRPPAERLKINADGGFSQETGEGSWGFILRDEDGDVLLAGAGKLHHATEAWQSELLACIQ